MARAANKAAGSGNRRNGGSAISPMAVGSGSINLALRSGDAGCMVSIPSADQLAQPLAMMPPRPSASDVPSDHRTERSAHPDCGVNVNDPHANDDDCSDGVDQDSNALLLHGRIF